MTYHTQSSVDGSVDLPGDLVQTRGLKPGDRLSVARSGGGIVVRRDYGRGAAVARLRAAMRGYSVNMFLAERAADSGE